MHMIYLDHCATTPIDERVAEAMRTVRGEGFGNPSSVHAAGRHARGFLSRARSSVAHTLGVAPGEIIFTPSASAANNLALKGACLRAWPEPFHLVISAIEHDSVRGPARYLVERFEHVRLTEVSPNADGIIEAATVEAACANGASLVSIMSVNNEIGTRQPIAEIASIAQQSGAFFHTDAVHSAGRTDLPWIAACSDAVTLTAHKVNGPRGVGLLWRDPAYAVDPLVHGGHQEKGLWAGTENLEAIVGFARALDIAESRINEDAAHLARLEATFLSALQRSEVAYAVNGKDRVPGVLNLSFQGAESNDLVVGMDLAGIMISSGSACSSGVIEPSHVLEAMDIEAWRVASGVRISFGRSNTVEEAEKAAETLADIAERAAAESATAPGRLA